MLPVLHEETATEAPAPARRRPITSPLDATMGPIEDTGRMAAAEPPMAPATPAMPDAGAAAPAPDVSAEAAVPSGDLSGLGGSAQSAETIGAAVQAAGLDSRTRALLLFGMALVRLATAEAAGAAMAARQAGCSDSELALVVEMAHALGGGPSERLGHKILGM